MMQITNIAAAVIHILGLVFEERGKNSRSKEENQQQVNPRIAVMASPSSGFDPCPQWWETDSLTTVLLLYPAFAYVDYFYMNPVGLYHITPKTIVWKARCWKKEGTLNANGQLVETRTGTDQEVMYLYAKRKGHILHINVNPVAF